MECEGFTLVEIVLTALLMTLVGGLGWSIATAHERLAGSTTAHLDAVATTQRSLNWLQQDLRSASRGTLKCQCLAAPCPPGERNLRMDVTRGDPPVTQAIEYRREGGRLTKSIDGGAPQVVADGLSAFLATCGADGIVTLDLTATGTSRFSARPHRVISHVLVWS